MFNRDNAPNLGTPFIAVLHSGKLTVLPVNKLQLKEDHDPDSEIEVGLQGMTKHAFALSRDNFEIAYVKAVETLRESLENDNLLVRLHNEARSKLESLETDPEAEFVRLQGLGQQLLPIQHFRIGAQLYYAPRHDSAIEVGFLTLVEGERSHYGQVRSVQTYQCGWKPGTTDANRYFEQREQALDALASDLPAHLVLVRDRVKEIASISTQEATQRGLRGGD